MFWKLSAKREKRLLARLFYRNFLWIFSKKNKNLSIIFCWDLNGMKQRQTERKKILKETSKLSAFSIYQKFISLKLDSINIAKTPNLNRCSDKLQHFWFILVYKMLHSQFKGCCCIVDDLLSKHLKFFTFRVVCSCIIGDSVIFYELIYSVFVLQSRIINADWLSS